MKLTTTAALIGSLVASTNGAAISEEAAFEIVRLAHRALPNSPRGYSPSHINCPSIEPSIRQADSMSTNETDWVQKRRNNTVQPMRDFLTRMNISDFDAGSYIDTHSNNASALPNIGIAFSGGGWRALLSGAGVFKAFDSRTDNSTNTGQLGGLIQSATYVAGLSGGNWLVGSIFVNNFTTIEALQYDDSSTVWDFENSILEGPPTKGIQILSTAEYYNDLLDDVAGKRDAGFNTSITDYWGRGLSYQLINATEGGPSYTWSSIALTQSFQNADMPFPIVVSDGRAPGQKLVSLNSTNYEFNAFEMGSWDPTVHGFMPTQYLGTNMSDGRVNTGSQCTIGFDNAGFVMGTSSSLFNQLILQLNDSSLDIPDALRSAVASVLADLGEDDNDIADYSPNPFFGWNDATNTNTDSHRLTLVDGGEDGQNIPLNPLIQPDRNVDVIFAVDNSADINNWPNATALVATYERSLSEIANGTGFPSIPDQNTIVNLGLNTHPTFFGCNSSNITSGSETGSTGADVPLIVYLPNSPYITYSNQPTVSLTTNTTYRDALILNGYNIATMANGTVESTWPTCVACAILSRSFERTGTTVPDACNQCFERFCWNGTIDDREPTSSYNPTAILSTVDVENSADTPNRRSLSAIGVAAGVMFLMIA